MRRATIGRHRGAGARDRRRAMGGALGALLALTIPSGVGGACAVAAGMDDPGNVGPNASGWIGIYAREARGTPFTADDWAGLVCTLQFSALQVEAAESRLGSFLAAEVHARGVGADLDKRMTEFHRDFPEARRRLAASIRAHRTAFEAEVRSFFAGLREDVVAEEQRPTFDVVERAALRQVALSTVAPTYLRLEADPDWVFLRERCRRDAIPVGIAALADEALVAWREEADRLARGIAEACDAFMDHDRSPWGDGIMSGEAGLDDFKVEERLGRRLMGLQDEWIRHRRLFPRVLDGLVDPAVLERVMDDVLFRSCPHRIWIPEVDVRPAVAALVEYADASGDDRGAASARAVAALLEERGGAAAEALNGVCDAWRAFYASHNTNIPLLGTVAATYQDAYRDAGDRWAAIWRRTLEEMRETGLRGDMEGSAAAEAWDDLAESIEAALEAWDEQVEKYL